jgi:hypothetical protein
MRRLFRIQRTKTFFNSNMNRCRNLLCVNFNWWLLFVDILLYLYCESVMGNFLIDNNIDRCHVQIYVYFFRIRASIKHYILHLKL